VEASQHREIFHLSYIAGVLEGNPIIYCWVGSGQDRRPIPASEALATANMQPIVFEPKEALGIVNGTAISAAAASMTLGSMHNILSLTQLLTVMDVEAILGTATSFSPFISEVRPHPGQSEVASNILAALEETKLASGLLEDQHHALFQDRYSIRTTPQWLGPFLEDLLLANEQIAVELNSTTDNPLIDPETKTFYHGGNFQAVSVTTAMEKCRAAAQAIGRMLFYQFTEKVNPATNRGLPPNLCADEPSSSFTMKDVEINMASYLSELSFLGNTIHNHVVSAEMGNQALNSLALISARYADSSVDILTNMCACTLYGTCQALDLRAMNRIFEEKWKTYLHTQTEIFLTSYQVNQKQHTETQEKLWQSAKSGLATTTTLDTGDRFKKVMAAATAPLLDTLEKADTSGNDILSKIKQWTCDTITESVGLYNETRKEYLKLGDASEVLGRASKRLYRFIRNDLGVPMHKGVVDHHVRNSDPQQR
jgi:phenylalanine ammonia-lyase